MNQSNVTNPIIAGANLFSCCFFTVFAIKSFMPDPSLSVTDLLIIQSILGLACYFGKAHMLIGIGIAPWLYLEQSHPFNLIDIHDYQAVFLMTAIGFMLISTQSWTHWVKPYITYQPGVATACCFSALILHATLGTIQSLPSTDVTLTLGALILLILFEKHHQHYAPFLIFIVLAAFSSKWIPETPDLPLSTFSPSLTGLIQHPMIALKASIYLFSIMFIDLSACLMAISPTLSIKPSHHNTIRKTHAFNSLIASFFGAGQPLIYFENLILKSFSEKERLTAPLFSGLCFLLMALVIGHYELNIALLSSVFSLYLFYLVLKGAVSNKTIENYFIFLISFALFHWTSLNYIETLALVTLTSHAFGFFQQHIALNGLKKNTILCFTIFLIDFILTN